MELFKEILVSFLQKEEAHVVFPNLSISVAEIVETECYKALKNIKAVIEDDNLDDEECFMKIENIISEFEKIGSGGGSRHDFG